MTSATVRGGHARYAEPQGLGLVVFAAMILMVVGILNVIHGIAAIANSHLFVANAHYVIGDLRAWGWVALILGAVQILSGAGVMAGNQLARWVGVVAIAFNLIGQMFFIPAYPFWSLTIMAIDVFALWGLCMYGSKSNVTA